MHDRNAAADRRMAETGQLVKYLPRILLYPLSGHALATLVLLGCLLLLGMQSIFGVALLAITAPWTFQYAEAVIEQTASGRATPPQFGGEMIFLGSNFNAFRPLVGVALAVSGLAVARQYGAGAEIAVLALTAFLFPAFMLVLTVDNKLLEALNPFRLGSVILAVGGVYWVLCLLLALAAVGVAVSVNSGVEAVAIFGSIYLWLVAFHLLGYITFHRAEQLGFEVKHGAVTEASRAMELQVERLAAVVRNVDAALNAKDLDGAGRALIADPGGPADPRLFHEELFEQVQRRRNIALVHLQGQRLLGLLVREKRLARALDVAETCFDAHRDFQPDTPAQAIALAEAALQARRDGLFARLTHDAATRYAATPAAVSLQFLAAKHACEHQRDEARARELLQPLLAQTAHPQHRQIAALARILGLK
ncbi:MAG: hypothetical protein ACT4PK_05415 [Gammaproteobacteria bacterium]